MKKLFPFILLGLSLSACKKEPVNKQEEKLIDLRGSYQSSNTMELAAPVMYTQGGTITDAQVIKDFVKRRNGTRLFSFEAGAEAVQTELISISIDERQKAVRLASGPSFTGISTGLLHRTPKMIWLYKIM